MEVTLPPLEVVVVAPLFVMFVGWAGRTFWPHLRRACMKRLGQRRCARGQHSMREIDRRVLADPDGPNEELLIGCEWCGHKLTLDADDFW